MYFSGVVHLLFALHHRRISFNFIKVAPSNSRKTIKHFGRPKRLEIIVQHLAVEDTTT